MASGAFRVAPPGAYMVKFSPYEDGRCGIIDILLFGRTCIEDAHLVGRVEGHVGGMDPWLANWCFSDFGLFDSRQTAEIVAARWIERHRDINAWWVPGDE